METKEIEAFVRKQIEASPKLKPLFLTRKENPQFQSFAVMGLNEEAGEVAGLACRECYKSIPMPEYKWLEELGDVLWYLVAAAIAKGFTLEDLWSYNVEKLEGRYGNCE